VVGLVPWTALSQTVLCLPLAGHVVCTVCTVAGVDGPVYAAIQ